MVRKTTKKVIKKRTKKVQKGKGIVDTELIEVALPLKRKLTLLLILKRESHLENKKKKIIKVKKFNLKRLQNPKLIKLKRRMLKRNSWFSREIPTLI